MNYTGIKKIVIFMLIAVLVVGCGKASGPWLKGSLKDYIPKPDKGTIEIRTEMDTLAIVYVKDISREDFEKYAEACYDKGYTEKYQQTKYLFIGIKDGWKVMVTFHEDDKEYIINLSES